MTNKCPSCEAGEEHVTTNLEQQQFVHGVTNPSTLTCVVPVFHCSECGFQWTDSEAEMIRHNTVQNFINGGKDNA